MNIKIVSLSFKSVDVCEEIDDTFEVGKEITYPNWSNEESLRNGIFYAENMYDYLPEATKNTKMILIEPVGETVRLKDRTKAQGVKVLEEIEKIPTAEEEPRDSFRLFIAKRIPVHLIKDLLFKDQEPNDVVRHVAAMRIPIENISKPLSPQEEPNETIRHEILKRILPKNINRIPTPPEEPNDVIRNEYVLRIPLDRISGIPGETQEPSEYIRQTYEVRMIEKFTGEREST